MVNSYVMGGLLIVTSIIALSKGNPWVAIVASGMAIYLLGKLFREML